MKRLEPWIVFMLDGKEICAYSAKETFAGELEETVGLLAFEYGCSKEDIKVKGVMR